MKSEERMKEKKFSRGGSSSRKRPRESHVDLVQGSTTRGRRQGLTKYKVPVEAPQQDKRKDLHAPISMEIIMVCVDE